MGVIVRPTTAGAVRMKKYAERLGNQVLRNGGGSRSQILDGFILRAVGDKANVIVTILELPGVFLSPLTNFYNVNGVSRLVYATLIKLPEARDLVRKAAAGGASSAVPIDSSARDLSAYRAGVALNLGNAYPRVFGGTFTQNNSQSFSRVVHVPAMRRGTDDGTRFADVILVRHTVGMKHLGILTPQAEVDAAVEYRAPGIDTAAGQVGYLLFGSAAFGLDPNYSSINTAIVALGTFPYTMEWGVSDGLAAVNWAGGAVPSNYLHGVSLLRYHIDLPTSTITAAWATRTRVEDLPPELQPNDPATMQGGATRVLALHSSGAGSAGPAVDEVTYLLAQVDIPRAETRTVETATVHNGAGPNDSYVEYGTEEASYSYNRAALVQFAFDVATGIYTTSTVYSFDDYLYDLDLDAYRFNDVSGYVVDGQVLFFANSQKMGYEILPAVPEVPEVPSVPGTGSPGDPGYVPETPPVPRVPALPERKLSLGKTYFTPADLDSWIINQAGDLIHIDLGGYFVQRAVTTGSVDGQISDGGRRLYGGGAVAADYPVNVCMYASGVLALVVCPIAHFLDDEVDRHIALVNATTGALISIGPAVFSGDIWYAVSLSCLQQATQDDAGELVEPGGLLVSVFKKAVTSGGGSPPPAPETLGAYLTFDAGATLFTLYQPTQYSPIAPTARVVYLGTPLAPARIGGANPL